MGRLVVIVYVITVVWIALVRSLEFSESSCRSKHRRLNTRDNAVFIINRIHDPQLPEAAAGGRLKEFRAEVRR
jgi:hypothetical protein